MRAKGGARGHSTGRGSKGRKRGQEDTVEGGGGREKGGVKGHSHTRRGQEKGGEARARANGERVGAREWKGSNEK